MLDSVLEARDRFLKPGGAVLPDVARIFVAGAGEGATGLGFWRDVYGLCMAPVADSLRQSGEPSSAAYPRCLPLTPIFTLERAHPGLKFLVEPRLHEAG